MLRRDAMEKGRDTEWSVSRLLKYSRRDSSGSSEGRAAEMARNASCPVRNGRAHRDSGCDVRGRRGLGVDSQD